MPLKPDSPDGQRFNQIIELISRSMEGTDFYGFVAIGLHEDGMVVASNANNATIVSEILEDACRVAKDKGTLETVIAVDHTSH